jgi:hypothetical protein
MGDRRRRERGRLAMRWHQGRAAHRDGQHHGEPPPAPCDPWGHDRHALAGLRAGIRRRGRHAGPAARSQSSILGPRGWSRSPEAGPGPCAPWCRGASVLARARPQRARRGSPGRPPLDSGDEGHGSSCTS